MFTGIQYHGTVYGNRPYKREMGETPEDMAKAVKWMESQEKKTEQGDTFTPRKPENKTLGGLQSHGTVYGNRPYQREMGETPEDMAKAVKWMESQEKKAEESKKTENTAVATRPDKSTRPREMGEKPEDVAKTNTKEDTRSWSEMTEQERVIDMYA